MQSWLEAGVRCRRVVLFLLLSFAGAYAQEQKFANLGDFKLTGGETLRDCRVGYRTFGQLNADKSNAILIPTWASGTTAELQGAIGPGRLIDSSKYYVIAVDSLSNGVSSSPSNSKLQPRMQFPKITLRDMVNTQHALLTKVLGIPHLKAVMGISMGGMQTFQWMVAYPDFMDAAIPIVGSPQLAPYDLLEWQLEIEAIEGDKGWDGGNYTTQPAQRVQAMIGDLVLTTPSAVNRENTRANVFANLAAEVAKPHLDANDHIRQAQAMMSLDVAEDYGGSLEKAAAAVKARVLVIVGEYDHTVTPGPAKAFAKMLNAPLIVLDSDCGHRSSGCEAPKIAQAVSDFLAK